jgi:hypothetical protein
MPELANFEAPILEIWVKIIRAFGKYGLSSKHWTKIPTIWNVLPEFDPEKNFDFEMTKVNDSFLGISKSLSNSIIEPADARS